MTTADTIFGLIEAADHLPIYMSEVGSEQVAVYLMSDDWEATVTVDHEGVRVAPKLGTVTTLCQATLYEGWLAGARRLGEQIHAVLLEDDEVELAPTDPDRLTAWIESKLDAPAQPGLLPERRLGAFEQCQEDALLALWAAAREA